MTVVSEHDVSTPKRVFVSSPYDSVPIEGVQGQLLMPTIGQQSCGTTGLSACMVYMPPGRVARPHLHAKSDIVVMVLEGFAATLVGPELSPVFHGPGEFIYVPEGIAHVAVNLSTERRLVAVEARTEPTINSDVVLVPEVEDESAVIVSDLQKRFAVGELEIPPHWNLAQVGPFVYSEPRT